MNKVTIKDGAAFATSYDGKEIRIYTLAPYLSCNFEIEGKFTYQQLWELIYPDHKIFDIVFQSAMGKYSMRDYDEFITSQKKADKAYRSIDIDWGVSLENNEDEYEFYLYPNVTIGGVVTKNEHGMKKGDYQSYSFMGAKDWATLPIKINTQYQISRLAMTKDGKEIDPLSVPMEFEKIEGSRHSRMKKREGVSVATLGNPQVFSTPFRVFDFLYGILYELTWYGSPEQSQEKLESLGKIVDEIKNDTKQEE